MINNERGSSLIIVMLTVLVLTTLGLAILSASIGGAKRTELREDEVVQNLDAIKAVNEGVAFIKAKIKEEYSSDMTLSDYQDIINEIITTYSGASIANKSTAYNISNKDYTRVLEVSSEYAGGKSYRQKVYITAMPSFLKYALGSRDILTINGSTYFEEGNIYANNGLKISNHAKYIYDSLDKKVVTEFPSVKETSSSFVLVESNQMEVCSFDCYQDGSSVSINWAKLDPANLASAFNPNPPTYSTEQTEFIEVKIRETVVEKLREGGFQLTGGTSMTQTEIKDDLNDPSVTGGSSVNIITSFGSSAIPNHQSDKSYLYLGNAYIDTNSLTVDKGKWLVINGDAFFENVGSSQMDISANILVTGNVYIQGKIGFDSTMYVLGDTTIKNAELTGLSNSELILMTEGKLDISKVNKFNTNIGSTMKAYLYTADSAEIYAVGSYISVDGGIFAKGHLEVNAFRGETTDGVSDLIFNQNNDYLRSRLTLKNNKKLFLNQAQGLPKVNKLEVLTDLIEKD
ncbi:hypothetical protein LS684_15530 [Cytobacillus spongiae]|uniref:hypothetical protein n=1 Tax=Cytobacillus spongiae TaxID=2901381 RepID=UPI001F3F7583|nr:hypothetical protein [Cytobacillus spongiae]UII55056.1 hypothetical protein LS684_15530 [Cytobacillus spongiae]